MSQTNYITKTVITKHVFNKKSNCITYMKYYRIKKMYRQIIFILSLS